MADRILTEGMVLELVPYSRTHLRRLIKAAQFPAPLRLSVRRIGWRESAVQEWIDSRQPVSCSPADIEKVVGG